MYSFKKAAVLICMVLAFANALLAQNDSPRPQVRAERANDQIVIDGQLREAVWQRPGFTSLKQRDPNEGAEPSEKTEIWVAYDDAALYVAARMYDSSPDSIMTVLGRRDDYVTADWFTVYVDSYYDRRNGFFFSLSAAGTLIDGTWYNDSWDDWSWDGVWEGISSIDNQGWVAEIRIPYSQLRFHDQDKHTWGVNFRREIGRKNELNYLAYTPRKESGFVSRFGDLVGIEKVVPPQRVEILPYINTQAAYTPKIDGDPFHTGSKYLPGVGADFKIGLGSNLTLDATVNPDFGQVEVDPAVVNLSDVESFFQEKRPFFLEGANTFNFGRGGSTSYWGFNWSEPTLFYSRRIGRTPQAGASGDYVNAPVGAHILGAGKITGKVWDGWNIGMIHAVTAREFAQVQTAGVRSETEVEPLSYYGIARLQKDFNDGAQGIGIISTFANRFFDDQRLKDQINGSALVTGIDGWTFLDTSKTYVVTGWLAASHITGSNARILSLQQSSQHYFQRPDAEHLGVDQSATSLTGYAGRFTLNKQKGPTTINAAVGFINPGFNSNDMGFFFRNDYINTHIAGGYRWPDPTDWYRFISFNSALFASFDYEGNVTWAGWWASMNYELPNYYFIWANVAYNPETISNRRTRGGPLTINLPGKELAFGWNSDSRKPIMVDMFGFTYIGGGGVNYGSDIGVQFRPAPNVTLRIGPGYYIDEIGAQWVNAFDDPTATATFGRRYVYANMNQRTLSANIRLNWTFTPQLSLQLFAQPLISSGEYHNFKELARPKSYDFMSYGDNGSTILERKDVNGTLIGYTSDPDGSGPAAPVEFGNPDFNFKSLRGNAVLRWEYRPGSTLYFVWTQSRSDYENDGQFQFRRSMSRLMDANADNIFMVKFTYWWSM